MLLRNSSSGSRRLPDCQINTYFREPQAVYMNLYQPSTWINTRDLT